MQGKKFIEFIELMGLIASQLPGFPASQLPGLLASQLPAGTEAHR